MLTEEKEDYLKAVYSLGGASEFIANKQIAQHLNIKPPSVSEMMNRLQTEGYIEMKAYKGSKLTAVGLESTLKLIKRHRIIECFLIESLNYSWDEVHAEAEVLEHRVSEKFIERLDQMLNYPKYCPHGSLIPRGSDVTERLPSIMTLNEGDAFVLKKVTDEYQLLQYLSDHHVHINDTLKIGKIDNANKIIYLEHDSQFIISFENAEKMFYQQ